MSDPRVKALKRVEDAIAELVALDGAGLLAGWVVTAGVYSSDEARDKTGLFAPLDQPSWATVGLLRQASLGADRWAVE